LQLNMDSLLTEEVNVRTVGIDTMDTQELLQAINDEGEI
jgi:N-acetylmuramic acid 6-phosphate (MurNAc-6-P) etherase